MWSSRAKAMPKWNCLIPLWNFPALLLWEEVGVGRIHSDYQWRWANRSPNPGPRVRSLMTWRWSICCPYPPCPMVWFLQRGFPLFSDAWQGQPWPFSTCYCEWMCQCKLRHRESMSCPAGSPGRSPRGCFLWNQAQSFARLSKRGVSEIPQGLFVPKWSTWFGCVYKMDRSHPPSSKNWPPTIYHFLAQANIIDPSLFLWIKPFHVAALF